MANIQLNIVTCPTYPDKFIRDNVVTPFVLLLSIVIVTLPLLSLSDTKQFCYFLTYLLRTEENNRYQLPDRRQSGCPVQLYTMDWSCGIDWSSVTVSADLAWRSVCHRPVLILMSISSKHAHGQHTTDLIQCNEDARNQQSRYSIMFFLRLAFFAQYTALNDVRNVQVKVKIVKKTYNK